MDTVLTQAHLPRDAHEDTHMLPYTSTHVDVHSCVCLHTYTRMHTLTHTCAHVHKDRHARSTTQGHSFFKMANYCCFFRKNTSNNGMPGLILTQARVALWTCHHREQRWQHQGTECSRVCATPGLGSSLALSSQQPPAGARPRPAPTQEPLPTDTAVSREQAGPAEAPTTAGGSGSPGTDRKWPGGCPHGPLLGWVPPSVPKKPHAPATPRNVPRLLAPGTALKSSSMDRGAWGHWGWAGAVRPLQARDRPDGPESFLGTWPTAQEAHLRVSPIPSKACGLLSPCLRKGTGAALGPYSFRLAVHRPPGRNPSQSQLSTLSGQAGPIPQLLQPEVVS